MTQTNHTGKKLKLRCPCGRQLADVTDTTVKATRRAAFAGIDVPTGYDDPEPIPHSVGAALAGVADADKVIGTLFLCDRCRHRVVVKKGRRHLFVQYA